MEAVYRLAQPKLPTIKKASIFLTLFGKGPERISVDQLKGMMENGEKAALLDMRLPEEHTEGHIPGSILTSAGNLKYLEEYSYEGKIVLYCTAGVRSYMVSKALAARGINGVVDLIGGIRAWEAAGGTIISSR